MLEVGEPRQANDALFRRLAEADTGIEHDLVACDAGALGDADRTGKEGVDIGHDIERRIGALAVMHDNDRHAAPRHQRRHVRIALQAPDVVDDGRAGIECPGGDRRLDGVDGHRAAERDHRRQDVGEPRAFLVGRDRRRAAIGPRGFRANVQDIGALADHLGGMSDGRAGVEELAAVGK